MQQVSDKVSCLLVFAFFGLGNLYITRPCYSTSAVLRYTSSYRVPQGATELLRSSTLSTLCLGFILPAILLASFCKEEHTCVNTGERSTKLHTRFRQGIRPGSRAACSQALQQEEPSGEHVAGVVAEKCGKAKLHLALAQCGPCPMSSSHSPKEGRRSSATNGWNSQAKSAPLIRRGDHYSLGEGANSFSFFCLPSCTAFSRTPGEQQMLHVPQDEQQSSEACLPCKHNLQS